MPNPRQPQPSPRVSLGRPTPPFPGVPSPESPTPEFLEAQPQRPNPSAQTQSLPEAQPQCLPREPSPRVLLECPTPEYLYQERVGMFEAKYFLTHVTNEYTRGQGKEKLMDGKRGEDGLFLFVARREAAECPYTLSLLSFSPAFPGLLFFFA